MNWLNLLNWFISLPVWERGISARLHHVIYHKLELQMLPQLPLRIGVTLAALALLIVHHFIPEFTLDNVSLVILAIALVPWLQPIFKTIKLPGGIELTLQDMKQEIKAAAGAAKSAELQAGLAVAGIRNNPHLAADSTFATSSSMDELARRYEEIRSKQNSGPTRTNAMTAVVREMIDLANTVSVSELSRLLASTASGDRLAAYSTLYSNPRPSTIEDLVFSVTVREANPFSQYWGLQAISRNLPVDRLQLPDSALKQLSDYASTVPPGSDREFVIQRILGQLRGK